MRTYKGGVYLSVAMLAGEIPNNEIPIQPKKVKGEKGTDKGQFNIDSFMWKYKYKQWVYKAKHLEKGKNKLYSLFNDQCYPGMKTQVEGSSSFNIIKVAQYSIKLIGIIQ